MHVFHVTKINLAMVSIIKTVVKSRMLLSRQCFLAFPKSNFSALAPHCAYIATLKSFRSEIKRQGPMCRPSRNFFEKRIPRDAIFPVLFGVGVLGVAWGLNLFMKWKANKYSDSSNQPVYEKRPAVHKAATTESNETSKITPKIQLPESVSYVIIGAGAAGMTAARTIRASDPCSRVLLIAGDASCGELGVPETGDETPPPYIRPPLSKGLWWRTPKRRTEMLNPNGDIQRHSWLFFEPNSFFLDPNEFSQADTGGVCLLRGNPVVKLNPDRRVVQLTDGQEIKYTSCLIATGARPQRVPELEHCSISGTSLTEYGRVTYFRNLADYRNLQAISDHFHEHGGRIAVVGSSQLASELAVSISNERQLPKAEASNVPTTAAAAATNFGVYHFLGITSMTPIMDLLPPILSEAVSSLESTTGVTVAPATAVVRASLVDTKDPKRSPIRLTLHRREEGGVIKEEDDVVVDHIVCAVGLEPRTELANEAGLELDTLHGGFLVNKDFQSRADVYVAGEAASFWDPLLGRRRRMEHINFAEESGILAALHMVRNVVSSAPPPPQSSEILLPPEKTYDPLLHSSTQGCQPSFWCSLGAGAFFEGVGAVDSRGLVTRTIFVEGKEKEANSSAVVFYLHPHEHRLMGVLLWNLLDDLFVDSKLMAPSRLNFARKLIADRAIFHGDEELLTLAQKFDLGGEIAESVAELNDFIEAELKAEEQKASEEKPNLPTAITEEEEEPQPLTQLASPS